jgi:pyruvate dehydrogenase E1 component
MFTEQENVFYYITIMNENYVMPEMPEGARDGIVKGMYLLRDAGAQPGPRVQLLGSGAILREVLAAADLLEKDFGVSADVWSATSFTELAREGEAVLRRNRMRPEAPKEQSYVERCLAPRNGPVVAATDYVRLFGDQIRALVPRRYVVLGTDGFGRSDVRPSLRSHFEVDRHWVALAALNALADDGVIDRTRVGEAVRKYELDPNKPDPANPS